MDHFVLLERPPANLEFPPEYRDRIAYDPASKRLSHRGFMSKAEFDRLCLLSEDWSYRHRLEDLFRLCTVEDGDRPRGLRRWLAPFFGGPAGSA